MTVRALATLRMYSKLRGRSATLRTMLGSQPWQYWLGLLLIFLVVGFFCVFDRGPVAFVAAGVMLGVLARDIGTLLRLKNVWPTLDRVLDWKAVERELSGTAAGA